MDTMLHTVLGTFGGAFAIAIIIFGVVLIVCYIMMPIFVWSIHSNIKTMRFDLAKAVEILAAQLEQTPVQRLPVKPTARNSIRVKGYDSIEKVDAHTVRIKATGATHKGRFGYNRNTDEWIIQFNTD